MATTLIKIGYKKPVVKRKSRGTRPPVQTATDGKYAPLCATILAAIERAGKVQKNDIPASCFTCAKQAQQEFSRATKLLNSKIRYNGQAPLGHWRMK